MPFVVAGALFIQNLDGAIINTSLPQMAATFGVDATRLSLGVTAYALALAAVLPASGWLADRIGGRLTLTGAIIVFTLASAACGSARDLTTFTLARVAQGAGGAMMAPVGRMIIMRGTAKADLLRATSIYTWPGLIAPVVGPALGGFITSAVGWRWNFFINLPICAMAAVLTWALTPPGREAVRRPFDTPGFLLSATALSATVYGLESLSRSAGDRTRAVALLAVGAVAGFLTLRHLRRATHPLLDMSVFKDQTFRMTTGTAGMLFRMTTAATPFLLPLLLQLAFNLSPWQAGSLTLIYFVGNLAMKVVTSPLIVRFGFKAVLVGNGLASGAAIAGLAALDPGAPFLISALLLFAAGVTRSLQLTALTTLAVADVPKSQVGSGSALFNIMAQLSICLGVSGAAAMLDVARVVRGAAQLSRSDFQIAFILVGAIGVLASLMFTRLPSDAGLEVSRRR